MNLMLNAIEAMKDTGGELTVTSQMSEDRELLIAVGDTGVGLPAENPDQIFESFVSLASADLLQSDRMHVSPASRHRA